MSGNYRVAVELSPEGKKLAASAKAASRDAIAKAFAAGLSVPIIRDGKIISIAPDGTETIVKEL